MTRRGKDDLIWDKVAEGIAPLPPRSKRRTATLPLPAPPKPEKPPKPAKVSRALKPTAGKPLPPKPALPDLSHTKAPGLDARSFEKLRRGKLAIEAKLDLHGHTLEAAHKTLIDFIGGAWGAEKRALLVITGKGGRRGEDGAPRATLRDSVPRWLNEASLRAKILAFAQAQPKHGGAGALYVLLKRRR